MKNDVFINISNNYKNITHMEEKKENIGIICYNNPDGSYCGTQEQDIHGNLRPHCWNCGASLISHSFCGHIYCIEPAMTENYEERKSM